MPPTDEPPVNSTRTLILALSGGGFRATLFHMGVVRFLRDAGLLSRVTHVCAVSGGSILAGHLGVCWGEYSQLPTPAGDPWEKPARKLIDFVRYDVRGRILRRIWWYALIRLVAAVGGVLIARVLPTALKSWLRRTFPTTPTLALERLYSTRLYAKRTLADLAPQAPAIRILATNLTTGERSAFDRHGLHLGGEAVAADRVPLALAVTASSAFPGFFPPVELTPSLLQVSQSAFGERPRVLLTDGGVYDNLGAHDASEVAAALPSDDRPRLVVSDASLTFEWTSAEAAPGTLMTAWRASDIVSHRVYKMDRAALARDNARSEHPPVVIPIANDPPLKDALPVGLQGDLPAVRTDLDSFSQGEIQALVLHGQYAAREKLRAAGFPVPEAWTPWRPYGQAVPVPTSLYPSRTRRYRLWPLFIGVLLLVTTLSGLWIAWNQVARRSPHLSLTWVPESAAWLNQNPELDTEIRRLRREGESEKGAGRISDWRVIHSEAPLPAAGPFLLRVRLPSGMELRAQAYQVRSAGNWWRRLTVRHPATPEPELSLEIGAANTGDRLQIVALLMVIQGSVPTSLDETLVTEVVR